MFAQASCFAEAAGAFRAAFRAEMAKNPGIQHLGGLQSSSNSGCKCAASVHGADTSCSYSAVSSLRHTSSAAWSAETARCSQVDGPAHYSYNTWSVDGGTAMKRRLLTLQGWTVVPIPFFEWDMVLPWQRQARLSPSPRDVFQSAHSTYSCA